MKTTHFIAAVGLAVGCCLLFPLTARAQPGEGFPQRGISSPTVSVEESARRKTDVLQGELGLNEKQYKKVYKLYLKQARKAQSASQGDTSSSGSGMGMMAGGGGRPGGGGGMGPGGGPPSGDGGGRAGGMGGGMPGSGGGEMGQGMARSGSPMRANEPYIEPEKEIVKRDGKMKKILSSEQYNRWRAWEREDITRQARQFMDQGMGGVPGQPGAGGGERPQRP